MRIADQACRPIVTAYKGDTIDIGYRDRASIDVTDDTRSASAAEKVRILDA